jgi:hypothetical protein
MRYYLLNWLFAGITIPVFSQQNITSGNDKESENGCSIFAGLGLGGNGTVQGLGTGGSFCFHTNMHTFTLYAASANSLVYHGDESDTPVLHGSYFGLTYGVGQYDEIVSVAAGAGPCYSFVSMSTGGGINYNFTHYEKYGLCFSGQFSIHGKHAGMGLQGYYNITNAGTDFMLLIGLNIIFR